MPQLYSLSFLEKFFILWLVHSLNFTLHLHSCLHVLPALSCTDTQNFTSTTNRFYWHLITFSYFQVFSSILWVDWRIFLELIFVWKYVCVSNLTFCIIIGPPPQYKYRCTLIIFYDTSNTYHILSDAITKSKSPNVNELEEDFF